MSTTVSVIIGVAFLAGSLVLTDTIQRTFDDLFEEINANVDAQVRSSSVIESDFGDLRGDIDESTLDEVLAVDGVAAADVTVEGVAQYVDPDGDLIGSPGQGPPTLGFSWPVVDDLNPMNLVEGRGPTGPGEVIWSTRPPPTPHRSSWATPSPSC